MNKQHVRNGREAKRARQEKANDNPNPPTQWWCATTKTWIREGGS